MFANQRGELSEKEFTWASAFAIYGRETRHPVSRDELASCRGVDR
jgi:hypothetical protein